MNSALPPAKTSHLSVVSNANATCATRLTRAQVAERIGASISTVRRYEGSMLHPHTDEDGVNSFDPKEVTALAASRANTAIARGMRNAKPAAEERTSGEIAALVFERLEQRQSLAEIVIGVRVEPDTARTLFDQWCLGLTEGQLRMAREPRVPRENETAHATAETLALRLAELPQGHVTRISVGRYRGPFMNGDHQYEEVIELGGFHVSGPCALEEITRRFGRGDYRVTAYGFDPPGLRWELLAEGLSAFAPQMK